MRDAIGARSRNFTRQLGQFVLKSMVIEQLNPAVGENRRNSSQKSESNEDLKEGKLTPRPRSPVSQSHPSRNTFHEFLLG